MNEKYITKNKTSYRLDRQTKKGRRGGSFKTLKEAIVARQYLIDHNWEYPTGREIYKYDNTYYLFTYVSRFKIEFQSSNIYNTIEEARKRRDYLESINWNEPSTKYLWEYNQNWYVVKNSTYKDKPLRIFYYRTKNKTEATRFRDKCLQEGFPEPLFVTDSLRFIEHSLPELYLIRRVNTFYGTTHNLRDAMVLRDLLEWNDWNLKVGTYIWHGEEYFIDFGRKGSTFQICKC